MSQILTKEKLRSRDMSFFMKGHNQGETETGFIIYSVLHTNASC